MRDAPVKSTFYHPSGWKSSRVNPGFLSTAAYQQGLSFASHSAHIIRRMELGEARNVA